eukprot:tig00021318_g20136.t1
MDPPLRLLPPARVHELLTYDFPHVSVEDLRGYVASVTEELDRGRFIWPLKRSYVAGIVWGATRYAASAAPDVPRPLQTAERGENAGASLAAAPAFGSGETPGADAASAPAADGPPSAPAAPATALSYDGAALGELYGRLCGLVLVRLTSQLIQQDPRQLALSLRYYRVPPPECPPVESGEAADPSTAPGPPPEDVMAAEEDPDDFVFESAEGDSELPAALAVPAADEVSSPEERLDDLVGFLSYDLLASGRAWEDSGAAEAACAAAGALRGPAAAAALPASPPDASAPSSSSSGTASCTAWTSSPSSSPRPRPLQLARATSEDSQVAVSILAAAVAAVLPHSAGASSSKERAAAAASCGSAAGAAAVLATWRCVDERLPLLASRLSPLALDAAKGLANGADSAPAPESLALLQVLSFYAQQRPGTGPGHSGGAGAALLKEGVVRSALQVRAPLDTCPAPPRLLRLTLVLLCPAAARRPDADLAVQLPWHQFLLSAAFSSSDVALFLAKVPPLLSFIDSIRARPEWAGGPALPWLALLALFAGEPYPSALAESLEVALRAAEEEAEGAVAEAVPGWQGRGACNRALGALASAAAGPVGAPLFGRFPALRERLAAFQKRARPAPPRPAPPHPPASALNAGGGGSASDGRRREGPGLEEGGRAAAERAKAEARAERERVATNELLKALLQGGAGGKKD